MYKKNSIYSQLAPLILMMTIFALIFSVSCSGEGDDISTDGDQDIASEMDDDKDGDTEVEDAETDKPDNSPALSKSHLGWKKPLCFDCHDGETTIYPHSKLSYQPPDCGTCHGYNGAAHADHAADPIANCAECHTSGAVQTDHLNDFNIPKDCAKCHVHSD